MTTKIDRAAALQQPAVDALRRHPFYKGKVQMLPKCPIRDSRDFAVWYTPGVAAPCKAIHADRALVYEHTNRANTIAVVSDGTRVLGLGDIGPEAGLPVMEGKALLFKYLGGVDAVPLCLATKEADEIVQVVRLVEPSFGGINLEDIAQPKCFDVLERLRETASIPVWHDDQQGSAVVVLAGLTNALTLVEKSLTHARIALVGMGAANVATYRLLVAAGVDPQAIVACDSQGILHRERHDVEEGGERLRHKWRVCQDSNGDDRRGGIAEALDGMDVCIAFSTPGPDIISPAWIGKMATDAVVFACANPIPEIWPWDAKEAGARIVATGRSDLANQVNNSLGFPGIFRGVLDVRARTISDGMALAAAAELAQGANDRGLTDERILPTMADWEIHPRVAVATAMAAQREGVARLQRDAGQLHADAIAIIRQARGSLEALMDAGMIKPPPA